MLHQKIFHPFCAIITECAHIYTKYCYNILFFLSFCLLLPTIGQLPYHFSCDMMLKRNDILYKCADIFLNFIAWGFFPFYIHLLKYGFCKKSLRKDEPLTSWTLFWAYLSSLLGGFAVLPVAPTQKWWQKKC